MLGTVSWCFGRRESPARRRSEEHTSELQSLRHLVCRLLLEKNKSCTNACPGFGKSKALQLELRYLLWSPGGIGQASSSSECFCSIIAFCSASVGLRVVSQE